VSSDISIRVDHGDGYSSSFEVGNMTSNVNRMLVATAEAKPLSWFDKVSCADARPVLESMYREMRQDPARFRALEITEWGAYDDFMPYLRRFYVMTRMHPRGIISNWY
jgi:hypothetical protein